MQSVSNEFKELAKSNARISLAKFIIKDSNTEIDGETIIDGFIEEMTCDNTSLVGNVMAKNIETSIYNNFTNDFIGKEIYAYTGQQLEGGTEEYVPRGTFIIDEVEEDISSGALKLKGLDYAIKFNKAWEDPLDWENNTYTLGDFAKAVCEFCGLDLETEEFSNSDYVLTQQPAFQGYQCRYVIQRIAEIATSNVFISPEDKVQIRLAPQNYVSAEGSSITLEESANSRLKIDEFEGETTQETTTGKNLLNCTLTMLKSRNTSGTWNNNAYTHNGITYTINADITINVNGTASANSYFYLTSNNDNYYKNMAGQTLRLVGCPSNGSDSTYRMIFCNNNWVGGIDRGSGNNFVVQDTYYNQAFIQVYNGTSMSNKLFKPMLTKDTSATYNSFEPYTNGASPNPTYPQPIEVVTGRQEIEVCGKNLFDKNDPNVINGYFTASVTTITSNANNRTIFIKCEPNTTYVYRRKKGSIFYLGYTTEYPTIGTQVYGITGAYVNIDTNDFYEKITTGANAKYLVSRITNVSNDTVTLQDIYNTSQIEIGNTYSSYEPYIGQKYEVNLGKNLLNSTMSVTNRGIDFANDNHTLTMSGTGSSSGNTNNTSHTFNLPKGTYTISLGYKSGILTTSGTSYIRLRNANGDAVITNAEIKLTSSTYTNNLSATFTLDNDTNAYLSIYTVNTSVYSDLEYYIQVTKGSNADYNFAPYFEPIFLGKINTYKDFIRKGTGKNLIDFANRTITSQTSIENINTSNIKGNVTLSLNFVNSGSINGVIRLREYGDNTNLKSLVLEANQKGSRNVSLDVTSYNAITIVFQGVSSGYSYSVNNVQLEISSTPTEYEPYGYKDKWYIYKAIGKVVLDGSENWQLRNTSTNGTKTYSLQNTPSDYLLMNTWSTGEKYAYCDKFVINKTVYGAADMWGTRSDQLLDKIGISFYYSSGTSRYMYINTTENLPTYLNSNNAILYYILATPIITEITNNNYPELLSQLKVIEKARSKDGITYIDVDSANLPFNLSLQYDQKVSEDIDINSIISLEVEDTSYKPYNAVTLALADGIEGENVTLRDESSIALYGERALVITANEFAINQAVREELIEEMFNSINGFNYVPMKLEYNSYDWLERYDRIRVQYDENNYYETYLFNHTTEFPSTIKSVIEDIAISENKVKYEFVPETQQKNVHTEIVVDKLNGTISEVVSTQEEFEDSLSSLTIDVDGIRSKVELNYDFVRETSGNNYVSVDDIQQEGLLELKITGTAISSGNLILHITNNVPEYIELPISTILKQGNVADELSIESIYNEDTESYELHCFIDKKLDYINNQIVTHSSNNNYLLASDSNSLRTESSEDLLLDDYVEGKENLGIISIPIQEGQHTFSIENFNNLSYYLKYAVLNNITSEFALKKHIVSEINQSAEQIQISADKVSLTGKIIDLTSDNISINSDNFKVDEEGKITATAGDIGGFNMDSEKFDSLSRITRNYTQEDLTRLTGIVNGTITPTQNDYDKYDLSGDRALDALDMLRVSKIISGDASPTKECTYSINSQNSLRCISIVDNEQNVENVNLGMYGGFIRELGSNVISVQSSMRFYNGTTRTISMFANAGSITCVSLTQTSTAESKKNFEPLNEALKIVKGTDIYKYNFKFENDDDKKHIGFVIGDNFNYKEDITSKDNDGADVYAMVSVLWKAVQEQQEQIEKMQKEIGMLKGGK